MRQDNTVDTREDLLMVGGGGNPNHKMHTASHKAERVLQAGYSDRVKVSEVKVVVGG